MAKDTVVGASRVSNRDQLSKPTTERFDNEAKILETVRAHLREARRNSAVGRIVFELDVNRGGVARSWVELTCRYRFLENLGAV